MNVKAAAAELFEETATGKIGRPYRLEWQPWGKRLDVFGPAAELDWMEGVPTSEKHKITTIVFCDGWASLQVYYRYRQAVGARSHALFFDYEDPAFPDNLIAKILEIVEFHELLMEVEKDEYNQFVRQRQREGCAVITFDDIPEGRYPKWSDQDG